MLKHIAAGAAAAYQPLGWSTGGGVPRIPAPGELQGLHLGVGGWNQAHYGSQREGEGPSQEELEMPAAAESSAYKPVWTVLGMRSWRARP